MSWIGAGGWWRKPGGKEKKIEGKASGHLPLPPAGAACFSHLAKDAASYRTNLFAALALAILCFRIDRCCSIPICVAQIDLTILTTLLSGLLMSLPDDCSSLLSLEVGIIGN